MTQWPICISDIVNNIYEAVDTLLFDFEKLTAWYLAAWASIYS